MTKPIMVIIDEAKWCRKVLMVGESRCALGWICEAAGVDHLGALRALRDMGLVADGGISNDLSDANDHIIGEHRKLELTRLFREQGMVLCFVDSSKPKVVEEPVKACSWVTA